MFSSACEHRSKPAPVRLTHAVVLQLFCSTAAFAISGYPVVSTHYVAVNVPSSILFSVWIPDAGVLPQSVNVVELNSAGQALGVVSTLSAATGSVVFSGYINITDVVPLSHMYQATYAIQRQIARLKSPTVSVTSLGISTVSDSSSYYNAIDSSFSSLLYLFDQNSALASSSSASNRAALDLAQRYASLVQFQFVALDAFAPSSNADVKLGIRPRASVDPMSMSSSGGFWATAASWLGLGTLTQKAASEQAVYDALSSPNFNPNDPAVQNFMTWYNMPNPIGGQDICGPNILATPGCYEQNVPDLWESYQTWESSKGTSIVNVAQNTAKTALVEQTAFGSVSDGTGDAITNIYQPSFLGSVAVNAATETGTGYIADELVDSSGRQKVFIGKVGPNQTLQLPTGQHNILVSYLDQARDIISNVPIVGPLLTLLFTPGGNTVYQTGNGWRMNGYDASRTNCSLARGPSTLPTFQPLIMNAPSTLTRIGTDGSLLFITGSMLFSYSNTGTLNWSASFGQISDAAIGPTGDIFVSSQLSASVTALSPTTGQPIWPAPFTSGLSGAAQTGSAPLAIDSSGTIYLNMGIAGELTAINPDGTLKWQNGLSSRSDISPVLSYDQSVALISNTDNSNVIPLAITSGFYTATGQGGPGGPPGLQSAAPWGTVYFVQNGPYYAQGLLGCILGQSCGVTADDTTYSAVNTYVDGNTIIAQVSNPANFSQPLTQAVDSTTGNVLWKSTQQLVSFSDANGTLYAIEIPTNTLVALNGRTGVQLWQKPFNSSTPLASVLLGDDGNLYVSAGTTLYKSAP